MKIDWTDEDYSRKGAPETEDEIKVYYRDGETDVGFVWYFDWEHYGDESDIVAYEVIVQ